MLLLRFEMATFDKVLIYRITVPNLALNCATDKAKQNFQPHIKQRDCTELLRAEIHHPSVRLHNQPRIRPTPVARRH